jgi:hypothetical protein
MATGDFSLNARYEALPGLVLMGDATRLIGFSSGDSSFEVVTRAVGTLEYQVSEEFAVRARLQYDWVDPLRAASRTYWSIAPSATYLLEAQGRLAIDVGLNFRGGDTGAPGPSSYRDYIAHVGVVISR